MRWPTKTGAAGLPRGEVLPPDLRLALGQAFYARLTTTMMGHAGGLCIAGVAVARIGGAWPLGFVAAHCLVLALRLYVIVKLRRAAATSTNAYAQRWRRYYRIVAVLWSAVSTGLAVFCILTGDDVMQLSAVVMNCGAASAIASRNAGLPRLAMAMLVVWLLPTAVAWMLAGLDHWPVMVLNVAYLVFLCAMVRRHYTDMRALIEADLQARQVRDALAARESELRAIFDNAAAGVVETDADTRILRVNPVYCRMAGRSEAELIGLTLADITHPDDVAAEARWQAPAEPGKKLHYEKRYLHPDGTVVWIRVSSCVMAVGPDGRPSRAVSITQDCTQQKVAEAALRASEEMLRLSIHVGRVGCYERDFRSDLLSCGVESRLMHGLPLDEEPVPFATWRNLLLPEDLARVEAQVEAELTRQADMSELEYRFMHPERGLRHIETRSRVEYDDAGQPLRSFGVVIDVTERRQAEAQIAHLAHHDALTGLPNRILFAQRLDEALARAHRGEPFALVCLDLDRFKEINDTLGHPVGDALLRAVTARLQSVIRPTDTVARLGGDEFALIQTRLERPADATAFAARLLEALQEAFDLDGYHVAASASIGVAIAPADGVAAEALMRRADMALYAAKADGRGRFRLFERDMDADLQARRTLELDLRRALETQQFELFYQPVVAIATRTVCGFEALLRWHHPTRGLVPPDRFIPLAEATGLLVPIGAWVLRQACAEAARWPCGGRVAVNLSAVQFSGAPLVQTVRAALADSGLDPHRLELEITETAMLQDTEATLATLHDLKALGVTIAMDDFGTGYSSLSYLQRFPFDKVKIDRSFTTHLGDRRESAAIVGAVIDLCQSLEMRTTAEGVETECQFAALARAGCDEAQGFYFSPPRPAGEIPAMVERIAGLALAAAPAAE
jgi:diguanylate cyclase (GGDEF)-like protein/PAS domain S-box-containing protein